MNLLKSFSKRSPATFLIVILVIMRVELYKLRFAEIEVKEVSMNMSYTSITHSGFLMKKGATFKFWKPRWFVLDSNRHQLRYYDNENDTNCKGVIDLADVRSVDVCSNLANKKHILEVRTSRRLFSLLAENRNDAEVWLEKIHMAIRE